MSVNTMMNYGDSKKGKLTYSMSKRGLPGYEDCSSFIYRAMMAAGFLPVNSGLGNTETLFKLKGSVLKEITKEQITKGCLFIAGWEGASAGSGGHTGYFETNWTGSLDTMRICHCSYSFGSRNVVSTKAKGYMGDYSGLPVRYFKIIAAASPGDVSGNDHAQMVQLIVDRMWGPAVTLRLQEYCRMSARDGVISHQYREKCNQYIYSANFDLTLIGSQLIKEMQRRLKAKNFYSGELDGLCGTETIKALQRAFKTTVDGIISSKSELVAAMQIALNNNKLPF